MSLNLVENIVNAVLYEGYILYPYRPSTTKNRQRFTFGRVYPEQFSQVQGGMERFTMQTECLVKADSARSQPSLVINVRFLQPMARIVGRYAMPQPDWQPDSEAPFEIVPAMKENGRLYQTWQEVVERSIPLEGLALDELTHNPQRLSFSFPGFYEAEPILDAFEQTVGLVMRQQMEIDGQIELRAQQCSDSLFKVATRIVNLTPLTKAQTMAGTEDEEIIMRTFASTHTILMVSNGSFISLMNPPQDYGGAASSCKNDGTWPVLVGDEAAGQRDTLLSSPIILYDYPEIAAESPGDLFDGLEIDEILTLRIMTMTDEEKLEMSQVDERARQILQRTEAMTGDHLMEMHGMVRASRPKGRDKA